MNSMLRRAFYFHCLISILLIAVMTWSVCAQVVPPNFVRGIGGNQVSAIAVDTNGNVYAGGLFSEAGNIYANNIAVWSPVTRAWSPLGDVNGNNGVTGFIGGVYAIAIDSSGLVYVGGNFSDVADASGGLSVHNIAIWNPATQRWSAMGGGVSSGLAPDFGSVNSLYSFGPVVLIGGSFDHINGYATPGFANAAEWILGNLYPIYDPGFSVKAITDWNNTYYVGGGYNAGGITVSYFNGNNNTWQPLPSLHSPDAYAVQALLPDPNGKLLVGGRFSIQNNGVYGDDLVEWDGTSFAILPGYTPTGDDFFTSLASYGTNIAVGGTIAGLLSPYDAQGDTAVVNNVGLYSPALITVAPGITTHWRLMGQGANNGVNGLVMAVAASPDLRYVYVGGNTINDAGGGPIWSVDNIAQWDSSNNTWHALCQNPPPTVAITSPSTGAVFTAPANIGVSANASDDVEVVKVDFYQNGVPIGTVTAPPYSVGLNNVPVGSYTLTVVATDNDGATASSSVSITVQNTPPNTLVINSQPQNQIVPAGAPATFSVSANTGSGPLSYQWYYNGTAITGANQSAYTIARAVPLNAGQYSVGVSDSSHTIMSSPATLTLTTGSVASGYFHSLALKAGGTVKAWGQNIDGQVGNGTTNQQNSPSTVSGLTGIVMVAAGADHSLALAQNGTAWAWGLNSFGQIGGPYTTYGSSYIPSPVQVSQSTIPLTGITYIAGGGVDSYAVTSDGSVWAWGYNGYGNLGNGYFGGEVPAPQKVPGLSGVCVVAAGTYHVLALTTQGTVYAWGHNSYGQLGNGTTTDSASPVQVPGLNNIVAVSANMYDSYALDSSGNVWVWGSGGVGQLGLGTTTDAHSPVKNTYFTGIPVVGLSSGYTFCQALVSGGSLRVWGNNATGYLGDGTTTQRLSPVVVNFPDGSHSLGTAGGAIHALSMQTDGTLRSWGSNIYGQLGQGASGGYSPTPGAITGF